MQDLSSLSLAWLPEAENWDVRVSALTNSNPNQASWAELVSLANAPLDLPRTMKLDRSLRRLFGGGPPVGLSTRPTRLAVLGSSVMAHLGSGIRIGALRRNLWLSTYEPSFGQYLAALELPDPQLRAFEPNVMLLALSAHHCLAGLRADSSREDAATILEGCLEQVRRCCRLARERFGCDIIVQTALPLGLPLLGNNEHRLPGSPQTLLSRYNDRLRELADDEGADLLALDMRAAQDGVRLWHDSSLWARTKQEISPCCVPIYGDLVARVLGAKQGLAAKCLVLDLDNTIWGGVVGDDGLEGLVLGPGSALGEAYLSVQAYARDLARRGVILAVCSKNNAETALQVFMEHPEMLLKRDDIAAFAVNWENKAANLQRIAGDLQIGLESLVFLDDNPFERDLVRTLLPMVAVPEIPADPAQVPQRLSAAGYFESVAITPEDLKKGSYYQATAKRRALATSAVDHDTYLKSLEMRLDCGPIDDINMVRVVQLINKTNQFNLTTSRRTEGEIREWRKRPGAMGWRFRLVDKFGDNGLICVVMGDLTEQNSFRIGDWLMSCRVLGRGVEVAVLNAVMRDLQKTTCERIIGRYIPTSKNSMVKEHYRWLGFSLISEAPGGLSEWGLERSAWIQKQGPIAIAQGDVTWKNAGSVRSMMA